MGLLRRQLASHWRARTVAVNTLDFGLPQSRPRVYVVGHSMRHSAREPPAHPASFAGQLRPRDLLGLVDNARKELIAVQRGNMAAWKFVYRAAMTNPARRGQYAFVDISRDCSGRTAWGGAQATADRCPCLMAGGPDLHVFALGEGSDVLSLDRPLRTRERALLQGFPPKYGEVELSEVAGKRVWGNAMSVPVVGSVLARELVRLLRSAPTQLHAALGCLAALQEWPGLPCQSPYGAHGAAAEPHAQAPMASTATARAPSSARRRRRRRRW